MKLRRKRYSVYTTSFVVTWPTSYYLGFRWLLYIESTTTCVFLAMDVPKYLRFRPATVRIRAQTVWVASGPYVELDFDIRSSTTTIRHPRP